MNSKLLFSIFEQDYNIVSEVIERIISGQFCCVDECFTCENNKFGTVTNMCPIIDLTKLKLTK